MIRSRTDYLCCLKGDELANFEGKIMKNCDLISVIIATYDRSNLIGRAIESVLNQSYTNFELLIIDDSIDDKTCEIVKAFNSLKIHYIKSPKKSGIAAARNLGIKHAKGKFIAFLDDDDEWLSHKLAVQIESLKKSGQKVGLVHSNNYVQVLDKIFLYHPANVYQSEKSLLKYDNVSNITTLIKKECFERVGFFDERIGYGEDWDFYLRASRLFRFVYLSEPLAIIHSDEGSVSAKRMENNKTLKVNGIKSVIEKHRSDFVGQEKVLAKHLYTIGSSFYFLGNQRLGREYMVDALRVNHLGLMPVFMLVLNSKFFRKIKGKMGESLINRILLVKDSNYLN
jgi:glycosyltransferase involved in cell wall biosynthesis